MSLSYKVKKTRYGAGGLMVKAYPSEWACEFYATHEPKGALGDSRLYVNWSCGSRHWTLDEAETFLRAGLRVIRRMRKELAKP